MVQKQKVAERKQKTAKSVYLFVEKEKTVWSRSGSIKSGAIKNHKEPITRGGGLFTS